MIPSTIELVVKLSASTRNFFSVLSDLLIQNKFLPLCEFIELQYSFILFNQTNEYHEKYTILLITNIDFIVENSKKDK